MVGETVTYAVGRCLLSALDWMERSEPGQINDFEQKELNVTEKFLHSFHRLSARYSVFILLVFISFLIVGIASGSFDVQLFGLVTDGIGALLLVRSTVRGKVGLARDTPEQVGRFAGDNTPPLNQEALKATAGDTIDGVWGGTLLFTGFMIQALAISGIL